MTPHNVIDFRSRANCREAVRKQREASPVERMLKTTADGLDAGMSPGEIRRMEAARCRAQIRKAAEMLALFIETPAMAGAFLRELADEMEMRP